MKYYGNEPGVEAQKRYSPAVCTGAEKVIRIGDPDVKSQTIESIMQPGTPADGVLREWLAPEPGDERADEEVLREAHASVGRHFEGSHFQEAETAGGRVRRIEFVNAEFGAVCVAGDVDEKIAEYAVGEPGRTRLVTLDQAEGDFEPALGQPVQIGPYSD